MVRHLFQRNLLATAAAVAILAGCNDSPTQPVPDQVQVTPSAFAVEVGDSVSLSASYTFGSTSQPADERVRWTSSDSSVLRVDDSGYAHALKYTGAPVTVTATASGVSGSADVYVLPTFDSLVVTLSATLAAGRTVHPTLALGGHQENAAYTYQELPELRSQVHLATSNPGIVSVESDGALRAVAAGHATITATLIGETTVIPIDVIAGYVVQPVPGTGGFVAKGVNDAAAIIVSRPGTSDALIQSGTTVDLGDCSARDLNNAGQVACAVHTSKGAFVYRPGLYSDGALHMLFDSTCTGQATGVTESGAVFGKVADTTYRSKPFIWTTNGVTYPTTILDNWSGSTYAVNSANHGVAVYEATSYPISSLIGGPSIVGLPHYEGRWSQARESRDG